MYSKKNNLYEKPSKPRLVLLAPSTSQPRYHRRSSMLIDAGYDLTVYAFHRGYYEENSFPKTANLIRLGKIENRKHAHRIPKLAKALLNIKNLEKKQAIPPTVVYAFGLDMALIGHYSFSRTIPLVYEVGDVQVPLPHVSMFNKVIGLFEKKILKRCKYLTVTSPGFANDYFNLLMPGIEKKTIIIENMMDRDIAEKFSRPTKSKVVSRPIKIGYIGAFKYENCIFPLIEAVNRRFNEFELHFFGDGQLKKDILTRIELCQNIFYHGSFSSNRDLKKIYDSVHISYVVYDNRDPNVRMALPNKLYDGPYFGVPIIVAENTLLSKRVRDYGIGLVVDPKQKNFAEQLLEKITPESVVKLSEATLKLDSNYLVESYDGIVPVLKKLAQK